MLGRPILSLLFLAGLLAVAHVSATEATRPKRCSKVRLRREWRDMSLRDRHAYISSVLCLQALPAKDESLPDNISRYEEFVVTHTAGATAVHGVGQFLPWHRQFGFLYETALKDECGYKGPFPFWDWTRDADGNKPLKQSPLFDAETGFGPDGTPGTFTMLPNADGIPPGAAPNSPPFIPPQWNCVTSGPFANLTLHLGPGKSQSYEHCLTRAVQNTEEVRTLLSSSNINRILAKGDYDSFWNSLDGKPFKVDWALHDGGHLAVSGDMTDYYTSPNGQYLPTPSVVPLTDALGILLIPEPIFYLHHAGIDRLWWKWQHANHGQRLQEIGGRSSPVPPYGQVTHEFLLSFAPLAPSVPVGRVMDTSYEPYCYSYP